MNSYLPFALFDDLTRDVNRLFDGRAEPRRNAQNTWLPAVDISETDDAYLLSMDVPGVAGDTIDISIENKVLVIKGERKIDHGDKKLTINERWQGEFARRFTLPDSVDIDHIAAKVENGVLGLHIPKVAAAAPRKITVQ